MYITKTIPVAVITYCFQREFKRDKTTNRYKTGYKFVVAEMNRKQQITKELLLKIKIKKP